MALISTLLLPVTQPRKTFSQKCFPQVLPTGSLNWRSTTVTEESLDQRGKSDTRGKIFEFLAKVIEFPAGKLLQVWLHPRIPGKFIRVLAGTVSQLELSTLSQLLRSVCTMGNSRNKRHNRNGHRHVFQKRKLPHQKKKPRATKQNKQQTGGQVRVAEHNTQQGAKTIGGSRIINMDKLKQYANDLTRHSARCGGNIVLDGETRQGLASILRGQCSVCEHTIILETSQKVKGPRQYCRWECNLAAVWGQMATGGGHSHLEVSMSVLGVRVMSKASFINTERDIGQWWKEKLAESMAEAGKEEKRLAERGSYHEGVPAITVILDGGWTKRSHKHSYNANSGVGIIVGQETGKLLHIGVRNRFCTACALNIPQHSCFKNWSASSSEMETDIMVEGFAAAEKLHGVRYTTFIGDGDSSVYPALTQRIPVCGHAIRKLECANHACKCYRGSLEKLVQDNPSYKGWRLN